MWRDDRFEFPNNVPPLEGKETYCFLVGISVGVGVAILYARYFMNLWVDSTRLEPNFHGYIKLEHKEDSTLP